MSIATASAQLVPDFVRQLSDAELEDVTLVPATDYRTGLVGYMDSSFTHWYIEPEFHGAMPFWMQRATGPRDCLSFGRKTY